MSAAHTAATCAFADRCLLRFLVTGGRSHCFFFTVVVNFSSVGKTHCNSLQMPNTAGGLWGVCVKSGGNVGYE